MKNYQRGLMTAALALCSYVAAPAYADVLNIPASAALMNGDPLGSGCSVANASRSISASDLGSTCDLEIPLTVPTGHTIQQIAVVHGNEIIGGGALIYTALNTLDFPSAANSSHFELISTTPVPIGTFQATRLMTQLKNGTYVDAFTVLPNTMYQVVVHLESGAFVTGLQVTYQ